MNAGDQFHVGIVADDFAAAMHDLTETFGYEWAPEICTEVRVWLAHGETSVELRIAYSRSTPRVEMVQRVEGTVWTPTPDSGLHHLGYWSDDLDADVAALEAAGYAVEARDRRPDGGSSWVYLARAGGPRVELVSRELQPALEGYWS